MCSFICTNKPITVESLNFLSAKRGPDHTESVYIDGFNMIHNLLDISKKTIIQPISKNGITILFNGEIYEPTFDVDTLGIIPLYETYGPRFVDYINGEYAILILDKNKNIIYLYSDIFATKPLFFSVEDNSIGVASYSSELKLLGFKDIRRVNSSSFIEINLSNFNTLMHTHSAFNLEEYKTDYADCISALENSLKLRCNDKVAVGISSGHDSGSILLWSLLNHKVDNFFYFVTNGREDLQVMKIREALCRKNNIPYEVINFYELYNAKSLIEIKVLSRSMEEWSYYKDESNLYQTSNLIRRIKNHNINIFVSGQGGDEILSNYCCPNKVNFFKNFNLKEEFPWDNFYEGENRYNIDFFEYVGGTYGVEVRYPFLDKYFVQEFLNLTNHLKQNKFKSVLTEYMERNKFVFNKKKVGMGIRPHICSESLKEYHGVS